MNDEEKNSVINGDISSSNKSKEKSTREFNIVNTFMKILKWRSRNPYFNMSVIILTITIFLFVFVIWYFGMSKESMAALISYLGSLIGGFVTLGGVYLTIKNQRTNDFIREYKRQMKIIDSFLEETDSLLKYDSLRNGYMIGINDHKMDRKIKENLSNVIEHISEFIRVLNDYMPMIRELEDIDIVERINKLRRRILSEIETNEKYYKEKLRYQHEKLIEQSTLSFVSTLYQYEMDIVENLKDYKRTLNMEYLNSYCEKDF
ncbi:hypothetical protein MK805_15625 [Shimazuella sp. AN120528]|uniref:hypothetical protein n=1 Tax=Shimazuella soli TaxID=1892854 RepID=UPI001F0DD8C4|nr:hypothetical protein [Shimazuella soli]MCH5586371.1 hypothetical protein [Shimazuella soli]